MSTVRVAQRVSWDGKELGAFIKQWYDRGFSTPAGGWSGYDIHHIRPRECGGTNDFDDLVPIPRDVHQQAIQLLVEGVLMQSLIDAFASLTTWEQPPGGDNLFTLSVPVVDVGVVGGVCVGFSVASFSSGSILWALDGC